MYIAHNKRFKKKGTKLLYKQKGNIMNKLQIILNIVKKKKKINMYCRDF